VETGRSQGEGQPGEESVRIKCLRNEFTCGSGGNCEQYHISKLVDYRTFKFGVKGSGSLIDRGKAESMRFLSWTQVEGMTSQNDK
jgi:hypothetical protein